MTEKTLTTENIKPALDALRGELAPWPVVAKKQDRLNDTQKSAVNSGITSSLVAQIIANTAAIRALESAITGTGLRPLVVASLPAVGTQGILYIVPVTTYDPATDADVVNYSNEYIWIVAPDAPVTEGYYEQVGQTGIVINDGTLTVKANNVSLGTFTANQSGNTDINITIPTNADYVDLTTDQTAAGVKAFSDGIVGNVTGTASRAIADEDGNSIKTGYGKLAGDQTWTGTNKFESDIYIKNTSYAVGTTPTANYTATCRFTDVNSADFGYVRSVMYSSGARTTAELKARNKFKNGALDTTGDYTESVLTVGLTSTGVRYMTFNGYLQNNLLPITTGSYQLGSSSLRWSSVYADSYYYGTTAWGLDKANTWTNVNTFNGSTNTVVNLQRGGSSYYSDIRFADETSHILSCIRASTDLQIGCQRSSNWADGSQILLKNNGSLQFVLNDGTNTTNIIANATEIKPTNSVTALGTSTNQWKSVYAQTYYYNGAAWGLDKANVWTGTNTFAAVSYGNKIVLKNTGLDLSNGNSGLSDTYLHFIQWADNSNTIYAMIQGWTKNSNSTISISNRYKTDANTTVTAELKFENTGTAKAFYSNSNSDTNLGTFTNKWKTLNGINPGALSLPDMSNSVNIDTTGWNTNGTAWNTITSSNLIDGYLYINYSQCSADDYIAVRLGTSNYQKLTFCVSANTTSIGNHFLYVSVPVSKQFDVFLEIKTTGTLQKACVFPCLGNV